MALFTQQKYFRSDYTEELSLWVNEFANQYKCSPFFRCIAVNSASKILKKEFDDNSSTLVCLEICTKDDNPIKVIDSHKVSLEQLHTKLTLQRKKFDDLLKTHSVLKFMEGGNAGRIRFDIITSKDEGKNDIIRFTELERAPIIDINKRLFRRSFPLSIDYKLLENTLLHGDSPTEELLLFANRHLYDKNPLQAVVSLLNPSYIATAFRVSPLGGLLTCHHNLSLEDHGPIEELYLHRNVVSPSYAFAGSMRERVEYVPCEMPELDANTGKDPIDVREPLSVSLEHQDIAFLRSSPGQYFLIPYAHELPVGEPLVCIGYPGKFSYKAIQNAYYDLLPVQVPDTDEYSQLFTVGNLSVSPGPLLGCNTAALACEVATTPGYSGSPICLLRDPRSFVAIHYRARQGKDYSLAVSVTDPGFYHLYSTLVVPELRLCVAELCSEDIYAINSYLKAYGTTAPLVVSQH